MRILFLNQYFPPDLAPTGVQLRELADALQAAGHTVDFVAARQNYRAGQRLDRRMQRETRALLRMLFDGLRRPRPDVVFSASSPPCLLIVATLLAIWHRARSVHWIMDLYPEIAVAVGEIRRGRLTTLLEQWMGWAYRRTSLVVALDEDMAERLRPYRIKPEIIRPWVSASLLEVLARTANGVRPPWTWAYSGNLGRAHDWETLLAAQALLEKRGAGIRLLIQGGGPLRPSAQHRAELLALRHCAWSGYIDEADLPASLLHAHVLAVTQLPAAQGLLWPSKLALLLGLPRPILWIGPTDGAIARLLRPLPQAGVFAPGEAEAVADWLVARQQETAEPAPAVDPAMHRQEALGKWLALFERLA